MHPGRSSKGFTSPYLLLELSRRTLQLIDLLPPTDSHHLLTALHSNQILRNKNNNGFGKKWIHLGQWGMIHRKRLLRAHAPLLAPLSEDGGAEGLQAISRVFRTFLG
ncbi:hypothetical protein CEXT_264681 [Caerostris extrusa]|uniref:Maturase K n=1 Tax=Caerostris extrusa TaxID=172846 RepID=A0AAV4U1Z0_CAEEX|nr:hypothetical protein CEXT_264681 [Caerostris extrusa]